MRLFPLISHQLLVAIACSVAVSLLWDSTVFANEQFAIQRSYAKGYELTASEESKVIKLAKKQGLNSIQAISSYQIIPSVARGITVQETERVVGRTILYRTVQIFDSRYESADFWHNLFKPRFSVSPPDENQATLIRLGGRQIRVTLGDHVAPEAADTLIHALHSGHVIFSKLCTASDLGKAELTSPISVGRDSNSKEYTVNFEVKRNESGSWIVVVCKTIRGTVVVTEINTAAV